MTCTTGDCDNPVDPNGFVRLMDCDCLGDDEVYPNCLGHTYCADCRTTMQQGGEFFGCVRCSSPVSTVSHAGGLCRVNGQEGGRRRRRRFIVEASANDVQADALGDALLAVADLVDRGRVDLSMEPAESAEDQPRLSPEAAFGLPGHRAVWRVTDKGRQSA